MPIRYIVDACRKFVQREVRRGHRYDAIWVSPGATVRSASVSQGPGATAASDHFAVVTDVTFAF